MAENVHTWCWINKSKLRLSWKLEFIIMVLTCCCCDKILLFVFRTQSKVEDMIQISLNCRRLLKARVLSSILTGRMRISREWVWNSVEPLWVWAALWLQGFSLVWNCLPSLQYPYAQNCQPLAYLKWLWLLCSLILSQESWTLFIHAYLLYKLE